LGSPPGVPTADGEFAQLPAGVRPSLIAAAGEAAAKETTPTPRRIASFLFIGAPFVAFSLNPLPLLRASASMGSVPTVSLQLQRSTSDFDLVYRKVR
jgi:hypothetical protein